MIRTFALLIAGLLLLSASPSHAVDPAGAVSRLKGTARTEVAGIVRPLAVGSEVFAGDKILTAKGTRIEIRMTDGGIITLGDDSVFTIGAFEAAERGRVLGLVKGVFLALTGKLPGGGLSPMTIHTPLAVIGVRGTTLWGQQDPTRLQVALLDGKRVFVESAGRRVELTVPLTGTSVLPGRPPTEPSRWSDERLNAAKRTVAFE